MALDWDAVGDDAGVPYFATPETLSAAGLRPTKTATSAGEEPPLDKLTLQVSHSVTSNVMFPI